MELDRQLSSVYNLCESMKLKKQIFLCLGLPLSLPSRNEMYFTVSKDNIELSRSYIIVVKWLFSTLPCISDFLWISLDNCIFIFLCLFVSPSSFESFPRSSQEFLDLSLQNELHCLTSEWESGWIHQLAFHHWQNKLYYYQRLTCLFNAIDWRINIYMPLFPPQHFCRSFPP